MYPGLNIDIDIDIPYSGKSQVANLIKCLEKKAKQKLLAEFEGKCKVMWVKFPWISTLIATLSHSGRRGIWQPVQTMNWDRSNNNVSLEYSHLKN